MNISNALYFFTDQIVTLAENAAALKSAQIHIDIYEEIKPGKTIRIDDLRQANPAWTGTEVRRDNGVIDLMFVTTPATQKVQDRLAARQMSEDMATEWLAAMYLNPKLADTDGTARVCIVGKVVQFNDWIKPGTVKMPVTVLRLKVNPR